MQQEINKITSSIIPEFSSGSSTHAVTHETTKRQALKALKPISNETPYKDTTGRGPAVKAAVEGLSYRNITAFTLIELLVVVLIIGILAAIALPQYQLAVYKAQITSWFPFAKALKDAQEAYYLEHGQYTFYMDDLDLRLPEGCTAETHLDWSRKIVISCPKNNVEVDFEYHNQSITWVQFDVSKCPKKGQSAKFCGRIMFPMSTAKPVVYLATTRPSCKVVNGSDAEYSRKVCLSFGGRLVEGGPSSAGEVYEL